MYIEPISLYKRASNGSGRIWTIEVHDWDIIIYHGAVAEDGKPGKLQKKVEEIPEGKGGRTRDEQIKSRLTSRINKQKDRGYVNSLAEAVTGTNGLGFIKPMLATPYKDIPDLDLSRVYAQYKYDGIRCLITKHEGKIYAYSRNGKLFTTITHITAELSGLAENQTLDGELYVHGATLQDINSMVRNTTKYSDQIGYIVYDIISKDPYPLRLAAIKAICNSLHHTRSAESKLLEDSTDLRKSLDGAINKGYEGLILRTLETGYEAGKRSTSLIKVKRFLDGEFLVYDVHTSPDGYGILSLMSRNGNPFTVLAPGTQGEKKEVADNPTQYIGRQITVKYANITPDGIPFHPVAINWRNEAD